MTAEAFLVSRPWIRAEVIDALHQIVLADPAKWMKDDPVEIDYIVHLFFDDNDLGSNPTGLIGDVLVGPEEAEAIKHFTSTLDHLIEELGDTNTKSYYSHADWADVIRYANIAYNKLSEITVKEK